MPLDVICPGCNEVFFETNDKDGFNDYVTGVKSQFIRAYDPDRMANAAMIRLKHDHVGIIDDIPHDADLFSEAIGPCPGCGNPFSDDNFKLKTRPQEAQEEVEEEFTEEDLVCHGCGKDDFITPRGLKVHQDKYCPAKHLRKVKSKAA